MSGFNFYETSVLNRYQNNNLFFPIKDSVNNSYAAVKSWFENIIFF